MTGILSNAISGLQASQIALRTSGHNISNANTEGYSRQDVQYVTRPEQYNGAGYIGSGVVTDSIERVVNDFLITQLRLDTVTFNELNKFDQEINKVDSLLANSNTGLADGLTSFFSAVQNGADDPSSTPARQLIISEANSLSTRFNTLYDRMMTIGKGLQEQQEVVLSDINALANSVANLNTAIIEKTSAGQGNLPNDLLDQRDQAIRKISELVSVQLVEEGDGAVNVMIGSGQPLVIRGNASTFSQDEESIFLKSSIAQIDVTAQISGGQLGGLLRFDEQILQPAFNELGRVGVVLADEFNRIQQQGFDLHGEFGSKFFTDINTQTAMNNRVIAKPDNPLPDDRFIYAEVTDASALTISDYDFEVVEGTSNYAVTRVTDNKVVAQGLLPGTYPLEVEFDGIRLHLQSGSFQSGDEFTVKPTHYGARDIATLITVPEDIAFAAPIRAQGDSGNIGTGAISQGNVVSLVDGDGNMLPAFASPGQLSPPVMIQFTSETTFDVLDVSDPGNPVQLNPPLRNQSYVPGAVNTVFTDDMGQTVVAGNGAVVGLPEGRLPQTVLTGSPPINNGYPVEQYTFNSADPITGATLSYSMVTNFNASAQETAAQISKVSGVSAQAFTSAEITDINMPNGALAPLQLSLNGEDLLPYTSGVIDGEVPDPSVDEVAFNDYLAEQINSNQALQNQGITAISSLDKVTGNPKIILTSSTGVNLEFRLEGSPGDQISINDGSNPDVRLQGVGLGSEQAVTVGGRIDVTLDDGVSMSTAPTDSQLFGDSSADDFAQSSFQGYQVTLQGQPKDGDRFYVQFNNDASNDSRNALRMVNLEDQGTVEGDSFSFGEAYSKLVEKVGTESSLSKINTAASKSLLQQSQTARDAVSGVNLDEEAALLIQYEQVYNANARVISVARDLFDTLLNSL